MRDSVPGSAPGSAPGLVLVVDVANVVGSRPDGWWRDRAGAAQRLLARLAALPGSSVCLPSGSSPAGSPPAGSPVQGSGGSVVTAVVAVVEGLARSVADVEGIVVVRAPADGDSSIVAAVSGLTGLVRTEDGRTDDGRTDDGRTDDGGSDDARTDPVRTDPVRTVLVVTADRGLRSRLPAGVLAAGPRWLEAVLPPGAAPA